MGDVIEQKPKICKDWALNVSDVLYSVSSRRKCQAVYTLHPHNTKEKEGSSLIFGPSPSCTTGKLSLGSTELSFTRITQINHRDHRCLAYKWFQMNHQTISVRLVLSTRGFQIDKANYNLKKFM